MLTYECHNRICFPWQHWGLCGQGKQTQGFYAVRIESAELSGIFKAVVDLHWSKSWAMVVICGFHEAVRFYC